MESGQSPARRVERHSLIANRIRLGGNDKYSDFHVIGMRPRRLEGPRRRRGSLRMSYVSIIIAVGILVLAIGSFVYLATTLENVWKLSGWRKRKR